MTTTPINQDTINDAVWAACDTFRGTVDPSIYKDYVLTMLFLKYISDVWQDHYDEYKAKHGDHPELIQELLNNERFVLPRSANFYALHAARHEPGNGERIDKALHAIEEANSAQAAQTSSRTSTSTPPSSATRRRRTTSCATCSKTSPSPSSTCARAASASSTSSATPTNS